MTLVTGNLAAVRFENSTSFVFCESGVKDSSIDFLKRHSFVFMFSWVFLIIVIFKF